MFIDDFSWLLSVELGLTEVLAHTIELEQGSEPCVHVIDCRDHHVIDKLESLLLEHRVSSVGTDQAHVSQVRQNSVFFT